MKRSGFRFAESALDRFLSVHLTNSQYNRLVWGAYPYLWRIGSLAGVRTAREAVSGNIESFTKFVQKKTDELRKQHGCQKVEYSVETQGGQVRLKAKAKL